MAAAPVDPGMALQRALGIGDFALHQGGKLLGLQGLVKDQSGHIDINLAPVAGQIMGDRHLRQFAVHRRGAQGRRGGDPAIGIGQPGILGVHRGEAMVLRCVLNAEMGLIDDQTPIRPAKIP